ncbi:response regulator [Pararhodobacter sp.]|uniref:response regulator transcription factor n=1 Tax=Pararhodobacter sp. TaxID=2127056 RepID=UPI002AFF0116|nr:response regulator [Pararhodobacter sp.]
MANDDLHRPGAAPVAPGARLGAGRAVLVVEDEPNIGEAIRFILRRDGWDVTVLESGENIKATIAALQPAVMILDVMLPDQSGFDILRALRAAPPTKNLPVILLTAKGQSASRDLAMECGASAFMAKPFANRDLLDAVRNLVMG